MIVARNPPTRKEVQQVSDYVSRRAKARFYADENFPTKATDLVRRIGARVRTAQEVGLIGVPDENQLAYTRRNEMILLTCDRDFLDERRFPLIHCPAIFVFNFGKGSLREMRQALQCLGSPLRAPQFYDKVG